MKDDDRVDRWVADLLSTLDQAAELVERGEDAYRLHSALPLAFEALSNRVGELAKRLVSASPEQFSAAIFRQAARNRDFVAHHDDRVDHAILWRTVRDSFPRLRDALEDAARS